MDLDRLDQGLIDALKQDGRMSYTDLAVRLGVAEGTARNRLQRLLESETIRIAPIVDQSKLGYVLNVWIGVRCRPGAFRDVARAFAKHDRVRYVGAATGAYDVICEAVFRSQEEMLAFLEDDVSMIDGVAETQSSIVLEIAKLAYEWELRGEATPGPIVRHGEVPP